MKEIVMICSEHGELTAIQVNKGGTKNGKIRYKCKRCVAATRLKYWENNKAREMKRHELYKAKRKTYFEHEKEKKQKRDTEKTIAKIRKGTQLKKEDIPQEIVDMQAAVDEIKKQSKKMADAVKLCEKHGWLTRDEVNMNSTTTTRSFKCKACQKEQARRYYLKNKKKVLEDCKKYRDENKEKVREIKYKSWLKNKHKYVKNIADIRARSYYKNYSQRRQRENNQKIKNRINLTDGYIANLLTKRTKMSASDMPKEIIEISRAVIEIKRMKRDRWKKENNDE